MSLSNMHLHSYHLDVMNGAMIKNKLTLFLIDKEIQSGAVAKSYMRKGLVIYEEMHKYFTI
jgi:hypothetical protein